LKEKQPEIAGHVKTLSRSPDVECLTTRQGLPVHKVRGKSLHSRFDPYGEAGSRASRLPAVPRVVFGLGDAYHIEAFLEKGGSEDIIVVEPDDRFFRTVLEDRDLSHILNKVRLVVGQAPADVSEMLPADKDAWFVHPPSGQINPRYLESLEALCAYQVRAEDRLRILVVGPVYGGSYPIACYAKEALEELGHIVSFADFSAFYPGYQEIMKWDQGAGLVRDLEDTLSRLIEQRAGAFCPDLIIFLAQAPVNEKTLNTFRAEGIRTAFWFVEEYQRMTYWERIAPSTDLFFTIQRDGQDKILASGAPCVRYLPLAAQPGIHAPGELSSEEIRRFGGSVSFMGAGYPNRRRFLARLSASDLKIWGNEWEDAPAVLRDLIQENGRRVSTEETVKIFNATRINLNLHSSAFHEEVDPHGDFVNPRTFEIAGCQAFQLTDRRSLLRELFSDQEVVDFEDLKEAKEKIAYFLEHDDERLEYARNARRRVLREHTYRLRMKELLGVLYEQGLEARLKGRRTEDLIQATEDTELVGFLSQFPGEEVLDLEEMAERVRCKKGLTRSDRVFLAMMAFKEEAG